MTERSLALSQHQLRQCNPEHPGAASRRNSVAALGDTVETGERGTMEITTFYVSPAGEPTASDNPFYVLRTCCEEREEREEHEQRR
jgi:hypothetical protein